MPVRLHRPADDRIVDMMRAIALRGATHVVLASLGDVAPGSDDATTFTGSLPETLGKQLTGAYEAVEQVDDLAAAEEMFCAAAESVAHYAGTVGTGIHAMLFRRDGTAELALPNAGVQTLRTQKFPGFSDVEA